MADVAKYLKPVSEEHPGGPPDAAGEMHQIGDLFNIPIHQAATWEPNWKELERVCESLMPRLRHVELAAAWSWMRMRADGLAGLADGLELTAGWVDSLWDSLYPEIDKESTSPVEKFLARGASLGYFEKSEFNGPYVMVLSDRVSLCRSRQLGSLRFCDITAALEGRTNGNGEGGLPKAQVPAVLEMCRKEEPEFFAASVSAVDRAFAALRRIEEAFGKQGASGQLSNFTNIRGFLDKVRAIYSLCPPEVGKVDSQAGASVSGVGASIASPAATYGGAVTSRADVIKAIDAICAYYSRMEPSSPVPLLMERARRMVNMNFLDIVSELTPEAINQARQATGAKPENEKTEE